MVGHRVEKGGMIGVAWGNKRKDFKLGEEISFSEQEILNLCLTAFIGIDGSVLELEKYVKHFVEIKKPE